MRVGVTCERTWALLRRRQRAHRHQHVFLAHDEIGGVQGGKLEAVAVGDGVGGAGFNAVAAEDAAVVVDVVDLGIALGGGDADFFGVFGGLDVNAVGWAGRRTQKAGYALFQAVLVALQHMGATVALLEDRSAQGARTVRVVFHLRRFQHLPKGDAHTLHDAGDVAHDRHEPSIRWNADDVHRSDAGLGSFDAGVGFRNGGRAESAATYAAGPGGRHRYGLGASQTESDDMGDERPARWVHDLAAVRVLTAR